MNDNMSRWLHYIVWISGLLTVLCPVCICISGRTSWWVCAFTIGLISITMLSGYVTWTILHNLLTSRNIENRLTRYFFPYSNNNKLYDTLFKKGQKVMDLSTLEKEISLTAQTFYLHLILPWYSYISPDEKYALQIRSALEDLLLGISRNVQQNTDASLVLQETIQLYIQSYRQFYKSLKKVAQKLKKHPINCVDAKEDIASTYKPLHAALRTDGGISEHFQRLSHFLLLKYLPSEVSKCNLFFVSLRDYLAYKFFYYLFDIFCDSQWLYKTLCFSLASDFNTFNKCLSGLSSQNQSVDTNEQDNPSIDRETDQEKTLSYTHGLSAIKEETSFEIYDVDKISIGLKFGNFISQNSKIISNMSYKTNNINNCIEESNSPAHETEKEHIKERSADKMLHNCELEIPDKNDNKLIESNIFVQKKLDGIDIVKYISFSNTKYGAESDGCERSVKSALGGFISTTAVPLLPDITSFPAIGMQCIPRKMWQSPVEEREFLTEVVPKQKKNPFQKHIVDGLKEDDYKRIYKKFQKTNLMKVESSSEQSCSFMKRAAENYINASKNGNKLLRSQSLCNLLSIAPSLDATYHITSIKHSFSSECIIKLVSENESNPQADIACRKDKKLKKMNSFDKNDGTDLFSLHSNASLYSQNQNEELYENHCTGMIDQIKLEDQVNVPKIINTPSPSNLEITQNETPSSCLFSIPVSSDIESPSFGWENPDLSPIYEESENLASTIAKLRCLLSERQSQHSLGSQSSFGSSESEPKSAQSDPGRYNLEKSKFTFYHKDSTGSLASMKSTSSSDSYCPLMTEEELLEATEVPVDGRVFTYISIPATEVNTELSGFQYTMYIIQYDAIYICEAVTPNSSNTDGIMQSSDPKVVLQTNFVKRRFREFLALHSGLEDDAQLRLSMKGIKGPNKWLNLPFSKLDAATISSRKQFLEKYLQALVQKPVLNMSLPLKEFLAYGSDTSITFAKKHIEINVPRLDKILARTVSGVFHSIKTALPTFDSTDVSLEALSGSGIHSTSCGPSSSIEENLPDALTAFEKRQNAELSVPIRKTFEVQLDITADEQICEMEKSLLAAVTATSDFDSPFLDSEEHEINQTFLSPAHSSYSNLFQQCTSQSSPSINDCCSKKSLLTAQISREESTDDSILEVDFENCTGASIFSSLVDAAVEVLSASDHPVTLQTCTIIFKRICTQPLTLLIKDKLDSLLTTEVIQELFNKVRISIIESQQEQNCTSFSLEDEEVFKKELKRMLFDNIPDALKLILGQEVTEKSLLLLIESMQHRLINQDFCLHLIDLVFAYLLIPV